MPAPFARTKATRSAAYHQISALCAKGKVQGGLATAVGIGAALSTTFGGKLVERFNFSISFLGRGLVSAIALLLLAFAFPETIDRNRDPAI